MPEFHWRAVTADGQTRQGQTEAPHMQAALALLQSQGLTPLKIQPEPFGKRLQWRRQAPVTNKEVLHFTSELAIMLKAGLSLDRSLKILRGMSSNPQVQRLLEQIHEEVKAGAPLSKAMSQHPQLFSDFYLNMVRSGEVSGQLASVLQRLTEHLERLRALRESVISAITYPAILLFVALISLVAMLGFVVPQFESLFLDMGDALPLPTMVIMKVGQGFREYGFEGLLLLLVVLIVLANWLRQPATQMRWARWQLTLPVIGPIIHQFQLTLFARAMGTLLANGVNLVQAIRISVASVTNLHIQAQLLPVEAQVKSGMRLAAALSQTRVFNTLGENLVVVGEETGSMGAMMLELSEVLNRDVETGIKRALTLLEPILILVLGLIIAGIIVSILLGILSVNDLAL